MSFLVLLRIPDGTTAYHTGQQATLDIDKALRFKQAAQAIQFAGVQNHIAKFPYGSPMRWRCVDEAVA